jgi:hypothetical protein
VKGAKGFVVEPVLRGLVRLLSSVWKGEDLPIDYWWCETPRYEIPGTLGRVWSGAPAFSRGLWV